MVKPYSPSTPLHRPISCSLTQQHLDCFLSWLLNCGTSSPSTPGQEVHTSSSRLKTHLFRFQWNICEGISVCFWSDHNMFDLLMKTDSELESFYLLLVFVLTLGHQSFCRSSECHCKMSEHHFRKWHLQLKNDGWCKVNANHREQLQLLSLYTSSFSLDGNMQYLDVSTTTFPSVGRFLTLTIRLHPNKCVKMAAEEGGHVVGADGTRISASCETDSKHTRYSGGPQQRVRTPSVIGSAEETATTQCSATSQWHDNKY